MAILIRIHISSNFFRIAMILTNKRNTDEEFRGKINFDVPMVGTFVYL